MELAGFQAFEKHGVEKDVAENIKKEFDKRHGPTWHCIVGRNFGSLFSLLSLILSLHDFLVVTFDGSCSDLISTDE